MVGQSADLNSKGTYVLVLKLSESRTLTIGALGKKDLVRGYYAYIGSAFGPGGLAARLKHHCRSVTQPRWHIDYLKEFAGIEEIWISTQNRRLECLWAEKLDSLAQSSRPVPGFGASDCKCCTHLFYFETGPGKNVFIDISARKTGDISTL